MKRFLSAKSLDAEDAVEADAAHESVICGGGKEKKKKEFSEATRAS